ncbi:MAG: CBS domain-containing protein [Myxococcota bacterium]|nr:CBS domain-containing protein [Myxococcota bacterium]
MSKTAREVMQTGVVTLSPDDPLHVAQQLFYEEGIHGAPVVDDLGRVVGVLSSTDVLRAVLEAKEVDPSEPATYRADLDDAFGAWHMAPADFKERVRDAVVSEYMTESSVEVAPDTSVPQLAKLMRENGIHRVIVVEDGALQGIVTTFDLVGLLEQGA